MELTKSIRMFVVVSAVLLCAAWAWASPSELLDLGEPVSVSSYVSLTSVPQGSTAQIAVEIRINNPWHINAHVLDDEFLVPSEITFEAPEGITVRDVVYPKGIKKKLDFSDTPLALYEGTVLVGAVVDVAPQTPIGKTTIKGTLFYQACDNQKCLVPANVDFGVPFEVSAPEAPIDAAHSDIFARIDFPASGATGGEDGESSIGKTVASRGLFFAFVLVFLGGLALNLTPCVYPIIPITVSY